MKNPSLKTIIIAAVLVVIAFLAGGMLMTKNSSTSRTSTRVELPAPRAKQIINKEFSFPIKDDKGKEINRIKFLVESAELTDEIVVRGQTARAVKGRVFLIIPIKITNDYNQAVQINTRDFLRLSVNGSKEQLAPDIHNDPVQVQAISVKYTRVGFPINETDKNLVLQIGEINGSKQTVKLNFK